jgi:hypothetical protein
MDDGCFAGWRVVAGFEGIFLTYQAAYVGLRFLQPNTFHAPICWVNDEAVNLLISGGIWNVNVTIGTQPGVNMPCRIDRWMLMYFDQQTNKLQFIG